MKRKCPKCGKEVKRILFSSTLRPHFYGNPDGYDRPSPARRHSYKLAAANGNSGAV